MRLYYLPNLQIATVCGSEALIRWEHPLHGLLPPYQFITLAESSRLINIGLIKRSETELSAAAQALADTISHLSNHKKFD